MAWELLLTSDIGIMSLVTIGFILVMGVYIWRYAARHAEEDRHTASLPNNKMAGSR